MGFGLLLEPLMIQDIVSFISMQHFTTDNSTKDKKKKKIKQEQRKDHLSRLPFYGICCRCLAPGRVNVRAGIWQSLMSHCLTAISLAQHPVALRWFCKVTESNGGLVQKGFMQFTFY